MFAILHNLYILATQSKARGKISLMGLQCAVREHKIPRLLQYNFCGVPWALFVGGGRYRIL